MSYYSVLAVTPTTDAWIPAYLPIANALVTKHGGKYLARTTSHDVQEGDVPDAALRIIIEGPSREAAVAFMTDPDYATHLEARTAGSNSQHVLIEGKDDLA